MRLWSRVVNVLVVLFALFFVLIGLGFVYFGLTGARLPWTHVDIEGGAGTTKILLGLVFFLAAAPMFYYVFHPSAKGMPPAGGKRGSKREPDAGGGDNR